MSNQVLSCQNVTANYGAIQALHGVNLEVNEGEIVVVLGANGAGKTTTLRAICNMVPGEGTVTFNGQDISKTDTATIVNAGIAHVPQGRGTFAALTVLENLEVGAYTRTDDEVESDIQMWLEKYPVLGERQKQAAGSLSGGEQQRVGVARAVVHKPKILLADEPTGNLDPQLSAEMMTLFRRFQDVGVTVLIATHDIHLIDRLGCRKICLEQGIVIDSGANQGVC